MPRWNFVYSLISLIFLTLLLYFTLFLKHTCRLSTFYVNELEESSRCCPVCSRSVKSKEHPFGGRGKSKEGEVGMFHAMLVRRDLANSRDLISCALSSSSPKGLAGYRWTIFSHFLCKRKRKNCHKDCGAEGLL